MGVYVKVSSLCKYYCSPFAMPPSGRAHWSSSQHIFNANWCTCYIVTCVEPSCQYHIYSVLATLLGLLLRDMGMHGADNPERNNPSWLAGWLPGFGRHTWIPGPVIKASLVLSCLRSCAANCNCQGSQLLPKAHLSFAGLLAAASVAHCLADLSWLQQCPLAAEPLVPTAKSSGHVWS